MSQALAWQPPNWKLYKCDAENARFWFDGYCKLADEGIGLLRERDKLRRTIAQLRAEPAERTH